MVKVFADKKEGAILGASIHGEEAATLISELAVAMRAGITVSQLAEVVAFPSDLAGKHQGGGGGCLGQGDS